MEIYMNQQVKMQAAALKDKKRGGPAKTQSEGAVNPNYENITLTFRNQDKPKNGHSPPKSQVPVQSRLPSAPTQIPPWLHRAIMSLYVLLALTFIFFIILSAMVLVKSSEMSQKLLVLKTELHNVSYLVRESQEQQKKIETQVQQTLGNIKSTLYTLQRAVNHTKVYLEKKIEAILTEVKKQQNPQPTPK